MPEALVGLGRYQQVTDKGTMTETLSAHIRENLTVFFLRRARS